MSTIPPPGPVKGPESSEIKNKEEKPNPARAEYEKALANLKEGKSDSFILKSREFRILSGEEEENKPGFFATVWAKVSSLWTKNNTKKNLEEDVDDLGYNIAVHDLRTFVDSDNLIHKDNIRDTEAARVDAFIKRQLEEQSSEPLSEGKRAFAENKEYNLEKALDAATPQEKEKLLSAEEELRKASYDFQYAPNDKNSQKLFDAQKNLSDISNSVLERAELKRKQVVDTFKNELERLKKRVEAEPKYTVEKEASGKWRIYIEAKKQLRESIEESEKEVTLYEKGERNTFHIIGHLENIQALINKYNDEVANYNKS